MGCISSKLAAADLRREGKPLGGDDGAVITGGDYPNHVVSLTSSTYGVLKLDRDDDGGGDGGVEGRRFSAPPPVLPRFQRKASVGEPEVINAWELMEDLDDDIPMYSPAKKKPTGKPNAPVRSPRGVKPPNAATASPRKQRFVGKENSCRVEPEKSPGIDQARVLKPFSSSDNVQKAASASPVSATVLFKPAAATIANLKTQVSGRDFGFWGSRRSFSSGPTFDPELVASFEKEHCEEGEQIKKMVSAVPPRSQKARDAAATTALLESLARNCPPGGEDAAILYTTTLRGIRKTFEDCNAVRAAVESHDVRVTERDISMDSGFREELRRLMGRKEVRVPLLFVKGRLVGGVEAVLGLEEEGKLGPLLAGIPRAAAWCDGCGGVRFVLCMDCSGSCKVLDEEENKTVKCGECNENGLIRCPICC